MPPKSSSAGRPRRATRAAALKSLPPDPPSLEPPSPATEETPEVHFSAGDSLQASSPAPEITAGEAPPLEAPEAEKATINGADVKEKAVPQPDVVSGSASETLAAPEETVNEGLVDNTAAQGGKNDVVEDNGGKAKKVVKKTVKVVKKVIKKVPKRVSKAENDSKIDDSSISNSDPSSTILGGVDAGDGKSISVSVQLNSENPSAEIDEKEKESSLKEVDNSEGCSGAQSEKSVLEECSAEAMDVIEEDRIDEKRAEIDEKEKESNLKEVDNSEGCSGAKSEKSILEECSAEAMDVIEDRNGECGKENAVLGDGKGEVERKEDDAGNVEGQDEEVGEGKLFSGELEAMERRKRRKTEIFIGGLDKDAKEEDIRKVFAEAGEIVDLTVVMNAKTGKNKGFAFLRYASAADAKRALEKFSKVEICGKQCGATPVEGNDTLFLGNIDKKWKDEDVTKLLQEIGIEKIDAVTVMVDPNNSECNRGFAFVEFETSKDAQVAYKKLQKKDVFGKNLKIKMAWAEPLKELDEEEMLKVKTVYAEFIPSSWNEERVRDTFKKFGEIDDITLARNLRTSKRKDFAFICYKTREAAIECIESFSRDFRDEDGTKVNVKVSLAKPMTKSKKSKPAAKPVVKEVPKGKPKTSHGNLLPSEPRNRDQLRKRVQPSVPRSDIQIRERPSANAELVYVLREPASWRSSNASLSNGPMDIHYANSSFGRKRPFSMLEADPLYPDLSRYPHARLDASFPVGSSSHSVVPPSGLTSSLAYQQQHSGYPSGSFYGARNYPSSAESRDRPHGSGILYHRY